MLFQSAGVIDSRSAKVVSCTLAADSAAGVGAEAEMEGAITGVATATAAAVASAAADTRGLVKVAMCVNSPCVF
jgi:hypothetical protein